MEALKGDLTTADSEFLHHRRINKDVVDEKYYEVFGERYLEYRALWKKSGPDSLPIFPIHLDVEVVDACNYKCGYCWRNTENDFAKKGDINTGKKFPLDRFVQIVEDAKKNNYPLYSVNLGFSGECTINKELPEFVKAARDNGVIDIRIITNGSLLTDDLITKLIENGITFISVSFDSNNEETYSILRHPDSFEKVKKNLIRISEIRKELGKTLPVIRASLFRAEENLHERDDFVESFRQHVDFIDIQPFTSNTPNDDFEIEPVCTQPFRRLSLFANGKVAPCCKFFSKQVLVGDLAKNSLKEIWDGERIEKIRSPFRRRAVSELNPVCVRCLKSINV